MNVSATNMASNQVAQNSAYKPNAITSHASTSARDNSSSNTSQSLEYNQERIDQAIEKAQQYKESMWQIKLAQTYYDSQMAMIDAYRQDESEEQDTFGIDDYYQQRNDMAVAYLRHQYEKGQEQDKEVTEPPTILPMPIEEYAQTQNEVPASNLHIVA